MMVHYAIGTRQKEEGFVKTCANIENADASRRWVKIGVILIASLMATGHAQALKLGPTHSLRDGGADLSGEGLAGSNVLPGDESANSGGLDNNPVAFSNALKRRCPQILEDPSSYDDDIVALCLQARKRM
jgi:hypothetical protein